MRRAVIRFPFCSAPREPHREQDCGPERQGVTIAANGMPEFEPNAPAIAITHSASVV